MKSYRQIKVRPQLRFVAVSSFSSSTLSMVDGVVGLPLSTSFSLHVSKRATGILSEGLQTTLGCVESLMRPTDRTLQRQALFQMLSSTVLVIGKYCEIGEIPAC